MEIFGGGGVVGIAGGDGDKAVSVWCVLVRMLLCRSDTGLGRAGLRLRGRFDFLLGIGLVGGIGVGSSGDSSCVPSWSGSTAPEFPFFFNLLPLRAVFVDMVVQECTRDAFGVSHLIRSVMRWCQRKTPKSFSSCFPPAVQYRVTVGVDDQDASGGEDHSVSRVEKWS